MKTTGVVTKTENGTAEVVVQRSSACASCHECEARGACHAELIFGDQTQSVSVTAKNTIGAKCGDRVEIESSTSNALVSAVVVFLVPFILTLLFYFAFKNILSHYIFFPLILIGIFCVSFFVLGKIINAFVERRHITYIVGILEESKENLEAE